MRHSASRKRHGRRKASAVFRRRLLLVPAILLSLVLGLPTTALAYWTTTGSGNGSGVTAGLAAPIASAARTAGGNTVVVSWIPSANNGSPSGFHVQRAPDGTQAWTDVCGTDAAPITGSSCSNPITTTGSWKFRVIAHKGSWRSTSNETTAVATEVSKPTVSINQAADQADPSPAPVRFTATFIRPVTGLTSAGITVTTSASVTKTAAYNVAVTGSGTTWTVTVTGLTSTSGTVSATVNLDAATDLFGNTSQASTSTDNVVTLDTVAPSPAITTPDLASTSDLGISSTDNITSATSLTFNGAAPTTSNGATARLYRIPVAGGIAAPAGTATVANGAYTIIDSTAPEGVFNYSVVLTDTAGNASAASPTLQVTVDRTRPAPVSNVAHTVIPGLLGLLPTNRVTGSVPTDVAQVEAFACDLNATSACTANRQVVTVASGGFTVEYSRGLLSLGGLMSVWITSIDTAGNKSLTVIDYKVSQ